jgi:hypothetical protein
MQRRVAFADDSTCARRSPSGRCLQRAVWRRAKFRAVSKPQGLPVNFLSGFSLGTNLVRIAPMESMEKIDDLIEIF